VVQARSPASLIHDSLRSRDGRTTSLPKTVSELRQYDALNLLALFQGINGAWLDQAGRSADGNSSVVKELVVIFSSFRESS
jgi:hypothetical protein